MSLLHLNVVLLPYGRICRINSVLHEECPFLALTTSLRNAVNVEALTSSIVLKNIAQKTSSGEQERCILKPNFELPYSVGRCRLLHSSAHYGNTVLIAILKLDGREYNRCYLEMMQLGVCPGHCFWFYLCVACLH